MEEFAANPRPGEVYNLGGGRGNSISMIEAIDRVEQLAGRKLQWRYVDEARKGDHICYISDLAKFRSHYPNWDITLNLDDIFDDILRSLRARRAAE
jgi:CDP-paratose 2-epimerase